MISYNDTKQPMAFGAYDNFLSSFSVLGRNASKTNVYAEEQWYFSTVTESWHDGALPSFYDSEPGIDSAPPTTFASNFFVMGPQLPGSSSPQTYNASTYDIIVLSMFLRDLTQGNGTLRNTTSME